MNKAEMIDSIATLSGLTKKDSKLALDAIQECIKEELANGGEVSLVGFATFKTREKAARVGRNPRTGVAIEIPAKRVVSVKCGKYLKDAVNA